MVCISYTKTKHLIIVFIPLFPTTEALPEETALYDSTSKTAFEMYFWSIKVKN